jgi:hypothetical protein
MRVVCEHAVLSKLGSGQEPEFWTVSAGRRLNILFATAIAPKILNRKRIKGMEVSDRPMKIFRYEKLREVGVN